MLPSSPCAAAPGLGVAAASAPAQVSPRGPRGGRELGAPELALAIVGPRGWVTRRSSGGLAPGAWHGAGGVRSPGGPGGCGSRHPGRGKPRGFRRRWASRALALGSQLVERRRGARGGGLGCVCSWPPPPGPSREQSRGWGGAACRWSRDCRRLCLLLPGFSTPGRVGSSSGTWLARSRAAQCQAWEDSSGQQRGPGLRMAGRTCRVAQCGLRRERSSVPEHTSSTPHPCLVPVLQATAHSTLTFSASSSNLALEK